MQRQGLRLLQRDQGAGRSDRDRLRVRGEGGGEGVTDAVPEVAKGIQDTLTELLEASRPA